MGPGWGTIVGGETRGLDSRAAIRNMKSGELPFFGLGEKGGEKGSLKNGPNRDGCQVNTVTVPIKSNNRIDEGETTTYRRIMTIRAKLHKKKQKSWEPLTITNLSLPRRRESSDIKGFWIPVFTGMTFLEVPSLYIILMFWTTSILVAPRVIMLGMENIAYGIIALCYTGGVIY